MSYLVTYTGEGVSAEISSGNAVYWLNGEARWVNKESIQYYLDNPSVFAVAMNISESKPFRLEGSATSWKDMIGDIFGSRLNSTPGKVDYNWDENCMTFESGGDIAVAADRVQWNQEINHDFRVGTGIKIKPHVHWFQGSTDKFVLTLQYRLLLNGAAKPTAWVPLTITASNGQDAFTYTEGTICQITRSAEPITIDCGVSDTLQFRMARTDVIVGDMSVFFIDLHGEVDSLGSEEEFTKQ